MTNELREGLGILAEELTEHASDPIIYARENKSIDIYAIYDRERLKVLDEQGFVRIQYTDMSFRILATLLVLDGEPTTPRRGDEIWIKDGYQVYKFIVTPFEGEPEWSWLDPFHYFLIVRTKRSKIEKWD